MSGSPSNSDVQVSAPPSPSAAAPNWKDEIAARVRARRNARDSAYQRTLPGMEETSTPNAIAARVAERYSRLPSWREVLAAQAAAAPPVETGVSSTPVPAEPEPEPQQLSIEPEEPQSAPAQVAPEGYRPDPLRYSVSADSLPATRFTPPEAHPSAPVPDRNRMWYPADPMEDAVVEPSRPLPASLLANPRELVAPRKARPRLAEGPLCEPAGSPSDEFQSRASVAFHPESLPDSAAPDPPSEARTATPWRSIHLDTEAPIREPRPPSSPLLDQPLLHVAPLEDRAMAALVDFVLTLCAFLLFCLVFALSSTHLPHGRIALLGACAILFAMGLLYQVLFFSLTDATPGMRYAKIALCTFDNGNPSRSALRGRIAALLLSALPLGLGFLWAIFDEDALGWHDRITRLYQRSYRNP